ncbi:energy transducer TonB [Novosphingobium sp.]|uniref:energy transducer TonB n=1 Tax=Novosphingobium sp. TaxID=1874826 RepID=UPI00286E3192|nr:energy transducer TonB [Novosphingobium sp.]
MSDYPASALRERITGTVRFRAIVDTVGRVSECIIVQSAGSPALDEATCRLVRERARFTPALNTRGKPVQGTYQNAVRWVIPSDVPRAGPNPGEAVMSMLVNEDGTMSDCRIEKSSEDMPGGVAGARQCGVRKMLPYRDQSGNPIKRRVVTTIRVDVVPVD